MRKTFIKCLWTLLAAGVALSAAFFFLIWFGIVGYSPDIENLQNPISKSASQVFSSDGKIIGTYNIDRANRIPIPYSKGSRLIWCRHWWLRRTCASMTIRALTS